VAPPDSNSPEDPRGSRAGLPERSRADTDWLTAADPSSPAAQDFFDDRLILTTGADWRLLARIALRVLVALQVTGLVWVAATTLAGEHAPEPLATGAWGLVVTASCIAAAPCSLAGMALVIGLEWAQVYERGSRPFDLVVCLVTIANWCVFGLLLRSAFHWSTGRLGRPRALGTTRSSTRTSSHPTSAARRTKS
jgi:hypothetical protein